MTTLYRRRGCQVHSAHRPDCLYYLRPMPPKIIMSAMTINRKQLIQFADWEAVAVAVSMPWSTSVTSILLVVWLLTLLATVDFGALKEEAQTAAGGLPILLWLLAGAGMLWAATAWSDRIEGLGGFHRLLMIPLLLAQFGRSDRGQWVLCGSLPRPLSCCFCLGFLLLTPILHGSDITRCSAFQSRMILRRVLYFSYVLLLSSGAYAIYCGSRPGGWHCYRPLWRSFFSQI